MSENMKDYRVKTILVFAGLLSLLILGEEGITNLDLVFKSGQTGIVWKLLTGGLIPTVVALVLENIISFSTKTKIVFLGRDLPGYDLMKIAKRDDILTEEKLINYFDELPDSGKEQNSLWYGIYRDVQNEEKVFQAQKEFLILRDFTYLIFVATILGGILSFFLPVSKVIWFGVILYPFFGQATYNRAHRFAAIVLNEGIRVK